MVAKLRAEHSLIVLPLVLALWSVSRVWTVLPSIMQDEYIYTSQAKNLPYAEQTYSNYIFSFVMGATKSCGTDFYSCTKAINAVFFLGTVLLTLLIALRFLNFKWSVFAASVTALSPVALPVSYFMPETMYFSMMTLTIWLTLLVSKKQHLWWWVIPGLALGVTALVKPHAIFMLPAFMLFALIYEYKKHSAGIIKGMLSALGLSVGFVVSKFGLGFAFAGTAGLKLFGGYGSPLDAVTSVVSKPAPSLNLALGQETLVAAENGATNTAASLETFLNVSFSHLLTHTAILLLLAGIPLILSMRIGYSVVKTKQPIGDASSFFVLIGLITISMVSVVALFEGYVTASGDDHSARLILRYYEFLIPQFLIMGLLLSRFTDSTRLLRIIQGSTVALASMAFAIYYPITFNKQFADSSTLPGLGDDQTLFISVGLFVSSAVIFWIVNPEKGNLVLGRFVIPAVLIFTLMLSQNKLIEINGTPAYFDKAGWDSRTYLQDVPGDRVVVIGQTRTEVFTVKFWIDRANISDLLVPEGSIISEGQVSNSDFVLTLGNIGVDFNNELVAEGEGYRLVRVIR